MEKGSIMMTYGQSDKAILAQMGQRLKQARLRRNISQKELADRAGLNRTTIGDLERGASASTLTLVQVLRALELLEELADFLPEPGPSPLELAKRQGKKRQRASGSRSQDEDDDKGDPSW
ncbi:MAG: putative transcriptional regulator [Candidatus Krumholzibacteriia bacterium]|jgi:putative transcriptional regulator